MTGTFKIHSKKPLYEDLLIIYLTCSLELCKNKLSCTSHHTGTLCVLHVSLYENGVLHLQTEKVTHSTISKKGIVVTQR